MTITLTIGQLIALIATVSAPLFGILGWLIRLERILMRWLVEHEMLMSDMANRNGISVEDLPTRRRTSW